MNFEEYYDYKNIKQLGFMRNLSDDTILFSNPKTGVITQVTIEYYNKIIAITEKKHPNWKYKICKKYLNEIIK